MMLSELKEGESARIVSVLAERGQKESLYSLGLLPGALIEVEIKTAGSIMLVRVIDEGRIAMTMDVAEKIEVERIERAGR